MQFQTPPPANLVYVILNTKEKKQLLLTCFHRCGRMSVLQTANLFSFWSLMLLLLLFKFVITKTAHVARSFFSNQNKSGILLTNEKTHFLGLCK